MPTFNNFDSLKLMEELKQKSAIANESVRIEKKNLFDIEKWTQLWTSENAQVTFCFPSFFSGNWKKMN